MSSSPSFPRVVDSSMRGEFVACPTAFARRYIHGYNRLGRSVHLHFGSAFAAGLADYRTAIYRDDATLDVALAKGAETIITHWGDFHEDHPTKTLDRCVGALEAMAAQYPPLTDHVKPFMVNGEPSVEFNFALPLPIEHPDGGPILYSGRFDMLAKMGNTLYVEDDKTASQLGAAWATNWRLRAQFTGYVWGAREFGYDVQGAIVRGISILRGRGGEGGYGHAEVIESRERWMIDVWHAQLLRDVRRMISSWQEGIWDLNLDASCASYGGCAFIDVCRSPNPQQWLDGGEFEIRHYNPLAVQQD